MQVNKVTYNYGYSNQKTQKYNQPSFGKVGNSLRNHLIANAQVFRDGARGTLLRLSQALKDIDATPLIAELLEGDTVTLRLGKKWHRIEQEGSFVDRIEYAARDVRKYSRIKDLAGKLPEIRSSADRAVEQSAAQDAMLIDSLISGTHSTQCDESLEQAIALGTQLHSTAQDGRAKLEAAKTAAKELKEFFGGEFTRAELKMLDKA